MNRPGIRKAVVRDAANAPRFILAGPHAETGAPALEIVFADGRAVTVHLDPAHARALGERLIECVDGRVHARPPSRRVLELEIAGDPR